MEKTILMVFAIIGILFAILVAYYLITRWNQTEGHPKQTWPPSSMMEMTGAQCPDYWVNVDGVNGSSHKCNNKFNIPMKKASSSRCANVQCTNPDGSSKTFSTLKRWPVKNRNRIRERCLWRDCCGPKENIPASWVGISETCGY